MDGFEGLDIPITKLGMLKDYLVDKVPVPSSRFKSNGSLGVRGCPGSAQTEPDATVRRPVPKGSAKAAPTKAEERLALLASFDSGASKASRSSRGKASACQGAAPAEAPPDSWSSGEPSKQKPRRIPKALRSGTEPLGVKMRRHRGLGFDDALMDEFTKSSPSSPSSPAKAKTSVSAAVFANLKGQLSSVSGNTTTASTATEVRSTTLSEPAATPAKGSQQSKAPQTSQEPRPPPSEPPVSSRDNKEEAPKEAPKAPLPPQPAKVEDRTTVWSDVFKKLMHDGEVHRDELQPALLLMGFAPEQEWIDEVYPTITKYAALSLEDFIKFTAAFEVRQRQAYELAFLRCDVDHSGTVEVDELSDLLKGFGIEPMTHVLSEVIAEVDEDGSGVIELPEFEKVLDILRIREGFTHKEYTDFMSVYHRFDRDNSGELDTKELSSILSWLGYSVSAERVHEIADEVDIDGSGTINEREYLMCMRRVREKEIAQVNLMVKKCDQDGNGLIDCDEIEAFLKSLGYFPDAIAIEEAILKAGFETTDSLDLSQLWLVLTIYRTHEGLGLAEMSEIAAAFERHDVDTVGEIITLEVGKLLRSLGYSLPVEVLQQFIARVDVSGSTKLEVGELRKLVRMYREDEVNMVRESFLNQCASRGLTKLPRTVAIALLGQLGVFGAPRAFAAMQASEQQAPSKQTLQLSSRGAGEDLVDLKTFTTIFIQEQRKERKKMGDQLGFSAQEVHEMKKVFAFYDRGGAGEIKAKEQIRLITDYFPEMAHDKDMRPQLLDIVQDVDRSRSGKLDFKDFLRLMQQLRELQDKAKVSKEMDAVNDTNFSVQEVSDFRQLFLEGDSGTGDFSLEEAKKMINKITPLGDKYSKELTKIFREVCGEDAEGYRDLVDFPDFLLLMKRLLEVNFARIRDVRQ